MGFFYIKKAKNYKYCSTQLNLTLKLLFSYMGGNNQREINMGGNAFKALGYDAQRMDLFTFRQVETEIQAFLQQLNIEYLEIAFIHDKDNFGDLDILVVEQGQDVFTLIQNNLKKLENGQNILDLKLIYLNGSCLSILYKGLYQIDFIRTEEDYKYYHQKYLSHNDLGNLLGRCVKEANYKHGHDGLFYSYYDGTQVKQEILISRDYREILNLLELNLEHFDAGFANVNEMFAFVASSKYFKPSVYYFENLNHTNRLRDAKRKNYHLFLKYVEALEMEEQLIPKLPSYSTRYPFILAEVEALHYAAQQAHQLKAKFNGKIIAELTGLKKENLGHFIEKFKQQYSDAMLISCSEQDIQTLIIDFRSHHPS